MKLAARTWAIGGGAVVAALAWWMASSAGSRSVPVTHRAAPALAAALPAATTVAAAPFEARVSVAPSAAEPAAGALAMVPVTLSGPDRLQVGEQGELSVAVGAHASVGEVVLTIRLDPNVLQVRAGTPGAWATGVGVDTRFSVEMTEAADQLQLRSAPASRQLGTAGGTVALVQFEVVGPGTTAVVLVDVTVTDPSGRPLPVLLSMAKLQVTAEAAPQPP